MRTAIVFGAPFAAIVSATPLLVSRQTENAVSGLPTALPSKLKPFKIEEVKPELPIANAKRAFIWYGPFTLRAANSTENPGNGQSMDPSGTAYYYTIDDILKDVTLLAGNLTAFNEDGSQVGVSNGIYTHHTAITDSNKPLPDITSCANGDGSASIQSTTVFGGTEGKANTFFTLPDGSLKSGFYVSPEDNFILNVDMVNYLNVTRQVNLRQDVTFIEKKVPDYKETSIQVVSLGICNGSAGLDVHPPQGVNKFSLKSNDIIITQDGTMFDVSGHLHDGGVNMVGKINGKEICDSKAIYGGDSTFMGGKGDMGNWETIGEMTTCRPAFNVSKGDIINLEAFYDLDKHPARKHVEGGMAEEMAIMAFFFAS